MYSKITRLVLLCAITTLCGCYSFSSIGKVPSESEKIVVSKSSNLAAYVSGINVRAEKSEVNTAEGFERRVVSHLHQSGYFSDVILGIYQKRPESPYVDLTFNINEKEYPHLGLNVLKGVFIGLTLYLLTPVLPMNYDFETDFSLIAKWTADGAQREYTAFCSASAYGTLGSNFEVEAHKAKLDSTERCLNSVINQLTSKK
ncbi:MAG: hypothetical protein E8D46_00805 [Nitrospira sp.]|nr:MAG: hypothetical protein E8D46_00805 [Nitrospira sp.]